MSISTITSKGQVTVPKNIRDKFNLHSGDKLDFQYDSSGVITVIPVNKRVNEVFGMLSHKSKKSYSISELDSNVKDAFKDGRL